jgi:hypothetical protein
MMIPNHSCLATDKGVFVLVPRTLQCLLPGIHSSCPELAVLANPDAAFEKCDFQMPFISNAYAFEMSAHPCAELVPVQDTRILDWY